MGSQAARVTIGRYCQLKIGASIYHHNLVGEATANERKLSIPPEGNIICLRNWADNVYYSQAATVDNHDIVRVATTHINLTPIRLDGCPPGK